MGLGSFLRSLTPGDDRQLAADLSTQRRASHRKRGAGRAARKGQTWEDQDRDRETGRRTRWGGR
jgi:hypothetical protein